MGMALAVCFLFFAFALVKASLDSDKKSKETFLGGKSDLGQFFNKEKYQPMPKKEPPPPKKYRLATNLTTQEILDWARNEKKPKVILNPPELFPDYKESPQPPKWR